jgi:NAD(P)-dependent dehydrogenase (short-subunit alcohol dehydrogenase family)
MEHVYRIDLTGKTIMVTGGYGHLGKAIVDSLCLHGARVFVLGRNKATFNSKFQDVTVEFIECDISSSVSIEQAFGAVVARAGRADVLINNAFSSRGQSPLKMTDEDWAAGIDGTLNSVFRCIRAVAPYMIDARQGKIINVSSMYGMVAPDFSIYNDTPDFINPPHYGAAKAGVIQLTKYYASYLGQHGINVNSVTPGPFPGPVAQQHEGFVEELKSKTILGRIGSPADLAGIFTFLSSEAANYITGQNFVVDGGWTTR